MKPTEQDIIAFYYTHDNSIIATIHHFLEQQASGDMLNYSAWYASEDDYNPRSAWNAARVGMIPAKNAITLPDESEWPKNAEGVAVIYNGVGKGCATWSSVFDSNEALIQFIPRTKPQPIKMSKTEALERLSTVMGKEVEIID